MPVVLTIEVKGVKKVLAHPVFSRQEMDKFVSTNLSHVANWVAEQYARRVPIRRSHDNTRDAIKVQISRRGRSLEARIGALDDPEAAKVLKYLEEGTGIYGPGGARIRPRDAQVLRWMGDGGTPVFRASVAGQKPQHPLENTYEAIRDEVPRRMFLPLIARFRMR